MNVLKPMIYSCFVLMPLVAQPVFAEFEGGYEVRNGGDPCEMRIQEIRDDIKSWIVKGGSKGLEFPGGMTVSEYNTKMLKEIGSAKISCTDETLEYGETEKTCTNKNSVIV